MVSIDLTYCYMPHVKLRKNTLPEHASNLDCNALPFGYDARY